MGPCAGERWGLRRGRYRSWQACAVAFRSIKKLSRANKTTNTVSRRIVDGSVLVRPRYWPAEHSALGKEGALYFDDLRSSAESVVKGE
jgi:hypothetical protein